MASSVAEVGLEDRVAAASVLSSGSLQVWDKSIISLSCTFVEMKSYTIHAVYVSLAAGLLWTIVLGWSCKWWGLVLTGEEGDESRRGRLVGAAMACNKWARVTITAGTESRGCWPITLEDIRAGRAVPDDVTLITGPMWAMVPKKWWNTNHYTASYTLANANLGATGRARKVSELGLILALSASLYLLGRGGSATWEHFPHTLIVWFYI